MVKYFFILFFLLTSMQARENPFFPLKGDEDYSLTSNEVISLEPLNRSSIKLPSSARVIKKITIEYENLDASMDKRTISLNHSVDWHLPLFVSQNIVQTTPTMPKTVAKSSKTKPKQSAKYRKIESIKFVSFYCKDRSLKVLTKDKLLRNFLLVEPHRIVLDFKRDTGLRSSSKKVSDSPFHKIRIGNHDGYYRAVIDLDGQYRYKMRKITDGYLFILR